MRLNRKFFARPTLEVCQDVLGKYLVRKIGRQKKIGKIVEVEAYIGPRDRASHAFGGKKTPRNRAEYLKGGHIYIYLVYGMYWQLNISTGQAGSPECFLIRALEPVRFSSVIPRKQSDRGISSKFRKLTNGPGKLCQWLKVDKSFYGEDVCQSKRIWFENGETIKPSQIVKAARVGIDYAGHFWAAKKWRFYIKNNPFVSCR